MTCYLQVADWEDVAQYFPDEEVPDNEEIAKICEATFAEEDEEETDASELDELTESVCEYESLWIDDYADR